MEGGEGGEERERVGELQVCEPANICVCRYEFTNSICMDECMR